MDEGWAAQQTGTRNMELVTTTELSAETQDCVTPNGVRDLDKIPRHCIPRDDRAGLSF